MRTTRLDSHDSIGGSRVEYFLDEE
jgi:hypothetical protein